MNTTPKIICLTCKKCGAEAYVKEDEELENLEKECLVCGQAKWWERNPESDKEPEFEEDR